MDDGLYGSGIHADLRRGRGATSNETGRFERESREVFFDGWSPDEALTPFKTTVYEDHSRSILTRNQSPDIPFDRSVNPYRGCEHGCIYCFARPSHAWLGMSPGLDFETRLVAKPDAPALLEKALRRKGYKPGTIAIGTNTDPYQPIEKDRRLMRGVLEVLRDFRHPVAIVTKSALVLRDIDILSEMAAEGLAKVALSVTSLESHLSRKMEPRASAPHRRLAALKALSEAGVPTMVMAAPMIPALNDHELESILDAAAEAGVQEAGYIALRLPREVSGLFQDWLQEHFPNRAARVMRYVREMHGGADYDPQWGRRMTGQGVYARMLNRRFRIAVDRLGLNLARPELRKDRFAPPPLPGDQLSFMDALATG